MGCFKRFFQNFSLLKGSAKLWSKIIPAIICAGKFINEIIKKIHI